MNTDFYNPVNIENRLTASWVFQSPIENFIQDPLANSIALIVLIGMLASIVGVGYIFLRIEDNRGRKWPGWTVPLFALGGIGVSAYLSFVEASGSEAICGPVGNCNSVQQSSYAYLFGVVPVGVLGMLGYILIVIAWLLRRYGPEAMHKIAALSIWGMALFGVLFSIYLTYLEPFVIGATCMWCITSAVLITLILWASTDTAKDAWKIEEEERGDYYDELDRAN